MTVNQFEENVQSNRNDAVDSGVGFIVSFGFFATMFIIATVVQLIAG
nr:YqzM family protein [Mesobacillus selenatarsenatis]